MKSINKRKPSKVTFKNHRKHQPAARKVIKKDFLGELPRTEKEEIV